MSDLKIQMEGGSSVRLKTAGRYCDRDIVVTASGGGSVVGVSPKAVNFRDYDGTVLHSYTKEEALALTALPELPTQPGLICQEWNWSLEDMQSYVADYGICEVGATYITDDGKTRLYITIAAEGRMDVPLYFQQTVANGVTIDWGDGSATETLSGTGKVNTTHTYASIGDYVITFEVADGCTFVLGHNTYDTNAIGTDTSRVYSNMLRKVEIGSNVPTISNHAFNSCYSLASIVIPNGVTAIGTNAFSSCYSLASIVIPNGVTAISNYTCVYCYSLASVVIPNSVTNINMEAFAYCNSLKNVAIPNSVGACGDSIFTKCYSLASVTLGAKSFVMGREFNECHSLSSILFRNGFNIGSSSSNTFYNCRALVNVKLPKSLSRISANMFYGCTSMKKYDFTDHTTVPTLSATNAFSGIPSDCEIRVPATLAEEWKAATNWSTYASQIVGV